MKPIKVEMLSTLVDLVRSNRQAFVKGEAKSTEYAAAVMGLLTELMKDGHIVTVSIWPQNGVTEIWNIDIDSVGLVCGGVLFDTRAIDRLLKTGRS